MVKLSYNECEKIFEKIQDYIIFVKKDSSNEEFQYSLIELEKHFLGEDILKGNDIFKYTDQEDFALEYSTYEITEDTFNQILLSYEMNKLNNSEIENLIAKNHLLDVTKNTLEIYYN